MSGEPTDDEEVPDRTGKGAHQTTLAMNLDTERRRLDHVEAIMRSALTDTEPVVEPRVTLPPPDAHLSYDDLTASNHALRELNGWSEVDLLAALTPTERAELEAWRVSRLPRTPADLLVVGVTALVGSLASVVDLQVDEQVRLLLQSARQSPLLQQWEQQAKRLPIDYTGPHFGGPAHRVRSAGHDLGRPLAALQQIRDGRFSGVVWEDGVRTVFQTAPGSYRQIAGWGEACTLWMKHLMADFVTPMSLPVPGWTRLYDLPDRELRKFAHDVYSGRNWGDGVNLRSAGLSMLLSVLSTEIIIRSAVHGAAVVRTGSPRLTPAEAAKRSEMLLAGHSLVGAFCFGHAAFRAVAEGPLALRHVNVPVLLRVGKLALTVRRDAADRNALRPPTWTELLAENVQPWQLDTAAELEDLVRTGAIEL